MALDHSTSGEAKVDIGGSLAPHVALLIPLIGLTGFVMAFQGQTGQQKVLCKSRPGYVVTVSG